MPWFVNKLYCILSNHIEISRFDEPIYRYGIELLIYSILSTAGLILMGWLFGMIWYAVIIIVVCYINQTFGGGYHAKTHMKCFCIMLLGLSIGLFLCVSINSMSILFVSGAVSGIMLIILPVVLHKNKEYLEEKKTKFQSRMRFIAGAELIVFMFVYQKSWQVFTSAGAVGLFLSCVSRIAAILSNHDNECFIMD